MSISLSSTTPAAPSGKILATPQADGRGSISIAVPAPVELQTNGTNNGSQSKLNLVAGSNITLTDDGSGDVTIAASGGGTPVFPRPGATWWALCQGITFFSLNGTLNQINCIPTTGNFDSWVHGTPTTPPMFRCKSNGASQANFAIGAFYLPVEWGLYFRCRCTFEQLASTTLLPQYIGLPAGAWSSGGSYPYGWWFENDASLANWQAVSYGLSVSTIDTGVPVDTNSHLFEIQTVSPLAVTGSTTWSIDGVQVASVPAGDPSTPPSGITIVSPEIYSYPPSGGTPISYIDVASMYVDSKVAGLY
jgi:hypothetical protein